ncbi:MAG: hypothetical protein KGI60_04845 [Patescibacteria group bacterium]|nr:hypothetical protein [Patescibacteria group bacterium]
MESFEDLMKKKNLGYLLEKSEELGAKPEKPKNVYIARFVKDGKSEIAAEFRTEAEYDAWYDAMGKEIEQSEGGKIEKSFGPSGIEYVDAEIVGATSPGVPQRSGGYEGEYKKLMQEGDVEKARGYVRDQSEGLLKKMQKENLLEKGKVFKIMYKRDGDTSYSTFREVDSVEEARDTLKAFVPIAKEEGYVVKTEYGFPEP